MAIRFLKNPLIRTLSGFPNLEPDEALLENAFTPVAYRGHGIMSAAMALIAERAADIGARNVLTFVGTDNIASKVVSVPVSNSTC